MKILILGAGKMGSFFVDLLSFDHETAVYDVDPKRLRFMYNTQRFTTIEEIEVVSRGDVRRAKLYYLRDRVGKSARIKEKRINVTK